jgi:hypothetical protein
MRASVAVALVLLVTLPAVAAAQQIEIRGPANADIVAVTSDGRITLGRLSADGTADIPMRLVDEDTQLEVVINQTGTTPAVALVERGRKDDTCLDTSPGGSRCRYTGTFVTWGRVERITITPAGEVLVQGPERDDDDGLDFGVGFIVGADVGQAFLADRNRICADAASELAIFGVTTTCRSDTTVDAWGAGFEVTFGRFIAAKLGYLDIGRVGFDVTAGGPDIFGELDGRFGRARGVTVAGAGRFDIGPFVPYVEGGTWWWTATTSVSAAVDLTPPFTFTESVELRDWSPIWGAGLEIWFVPTVAITVGFRNVRMQTDDTIAFADSTFDETFRTVFVGIKFGVRR